MNIIFTPKITMNWKICSKCWINAAYKWVIYQSNQQLLFNIFLFLGWFQTTSQHKLSIEIPHLERYWASDFRLPIQGIYWLWYSRRALTSESTERCQVSLGHTLPLTYKAQWQTSSGGFVRVCRIPFLFFILFSTYFKT